MFRRKFLSTVFAAIAAVPFVEAASMAEIFKQKPKEQWIEVTYTGNDGRKIVDRWIFNPTYSIPVRQE